jgi:predicted SAM-dependent methyltransferase
MSKTMKLHFGCFNCPREGWINTDVTPHIQVARVPGLAWFLHKAGKLTDQRLDEHRRGVFRKLQYLDVTRRWSFQNASLSTIYSSHVFEHLTLHGARNCLSEARRCLSDDGLLRLSMPDLDLFISEYRAEESLHWATNFFEANERSEKNMHHFMYNFVSLRQLLQEAGFNRVVRRDYREGECPDVEHLDNRPESLFVEAYPT